MEQSRSPAILHLSDLHFGATAASNTQSHLLQSVRQIVKDEGVKRIVITGDLFDNPETEHVEKFKFFLQNLNQLCDLPAVLIPGNHDERVWGLGKQKLEALAGIHWFPLVSDDELRINFVCFDSCIEGKKANGSVTVGQRRDAARLIMDLHDRRRETKHFSHLALIHHHPFSFTVPPESGWGRWVDKQGNREEYYLRMVDGEEFVQWCADLHIRLILHGHKHVPYHVSAEVLCCTRDGGSETRNVESIGCGSSTGKDVGVLSTNIINWDPKTGGWGVRFLECPTDGAGFAQKRVEVMATTLSGRGA